MPDTSYIICATPRCGSNLLCEGLWLTGRAGRPEEYFIHWYRAANEPQRMEDEMSKPWLLPPAAYVAKMLREGTTANGVFGFKIMSGYLDLVVDKLQTLHDGARTAQEVLAATFDNPSYIHITRRDKVRQAVSLAKAIQSRQWAKISSGLELDPTSGEWQLLSALEDARSERTASKRRFTHRLKQALAAQRPTEGSLTYDEKQLEGIYSSLVEQERGWERFFEEGGIVPYRVVYEEFASRYEDSVLEILHHLGIPEPDQSVFADRALQSQSDAINREWASRFREHLASRP